MELMDFFQAFPGYSDLSLRYLKQYKNELGLETTIQKLQRSCELYISAGVIASCIYLFMA